MGFDQVIFNNNRDVTPSLFFKAGVQIKSTCDTGVLFDDISTLKSRYFGTFQKTVKENSLWVLIMAIALGLSPVLGYAIVAILDAGWLWLLALIHLVNAFGTKSGIAKIVAASNDLSTLKFPEINRWNECMVNDQVAKWDLLTRIDEVIFNNTSSQGTHQVVFVILLILSSFMVLFLVCKSQLVQNWKQRRAERFNQEVARE